MPSKLPIIKANTTQDNIDKMKVIAESNKRSIAKELELLIENYIKDYESIHGEIDLELFKLQKFEKATPAPQGRCSAHMPSGRLGTLPSGYYPRWHSCRVQA